MGRKALALGTSGEIWISPGPKGRGGRPTSYRARAYFRGYDGVRREVRAEGRTRAIAEARLLERLRELSNTRYGGSLRPGDLFGKAAALWFERVSEMVEDGRRSPGTRDTYRRQLDNHVLPALAQVRLGEITTPLIDQVMRDIKKRVSPATARSSRSVISGVLGLAVRHGAISTNPVRDIERIDGAAKKKTRALSDEERRAWFEMLSSDSKAVAADLPDLTLFLLATGVRIGEALGLQWDDVDLKAGEVDINHQVVRVKGEGLVRAKTKSRAGERTLRLPTWAREMLEDRWAEGVGDEEPVFCDRLGGFRDPSNVRRSLREARAPVGSNARQHLGAALARARRKAKMSRREVGTRMRLPRTRIDLLEAGRVRPDLDEVTRLADLYRTKAADRGELLRLTREALEPSQADALTWITSHTFRRTTATILDDAGHSARQIADQLGHARPSLTQDVYMGRRSRNPRAAEALDAVVDVTRPRTKSEGKSDQSRDGGNASTP